VVVVSFSDYLVLPSDYKQILCSLMRKKDKKRKKKRVVSAQLKKKQVMPAELYCR
jgi:hypothetical protein